MVKAQTSIVPNLIVLFETYKQENKKIEKKNLESNLKAFTKTVHFLVPVKFSNLSIYIKSKNMNRVCMFQ